VARNGWAIITRDQSIQERKGEIGAVKEHGAQMFAIAKAGSLSTFEQLEILMSRWHWIERVAVADGVVLCTHGPSFGTGHAEGQPLSLRGPPVETGEPSA
jgi:hypothetical protein